MTQAFDKIMAGLDDARAYLNGDHAGFAVHEIEVSCPECRCDPKQDGTVATGLCQEHRHSARHAQELGAGPSAPGGTGARAARAD